MKKRGEKEGDTKQHPTRGQKALNCAFEERKRERERRHHHHQKTTNDDQEESA